jgi:hypothetical protein
LFTTPAAFRLLAEHRGADSDYRTFEAAQRKVVWTHMVSARSVTLGIAALGALLTACDPPVSILNPQAQQILGQINTRTLEILVINQTGSDLELDLLIDGVQQQVTCSTLIEACPLILSTCPGEVAAVQQRTLDPQGQFIGGRNFNDNAAFTFSPGEFDCDSTLVYKFTATSAEAFRI